MEVTLFGKRRPVWFAVLAVLVLTAALYGAYMLYFYRELTLLAAIAMIVLFARGDLKRLWNLPSLLVLGYVAYTAISSCWAVSGKFFLNQFSRFFPAVFFFVVLVLRGKREKTFVRCVTAVIADVSAIIALMSVEASSTGLVRYIITVLLNASVQMSFTGSRLYGVFGNSNIESAVFAIGVLFSLVLLQEAEDRRERLLRAATLAVSASAFVLVFSMGAIVCFAAAVVVYLITSGRERGRMLALMLSAAVPTLLVSFAASRFFNAAGALKILPLLLILLDAAVIAALSEKLVGRLGEVFATREKTLYGALLAVVVLLAVYMLLALRLGAPYTFGDSLGRRIPLAPGEHTLRIEADGFIKVEISSVNSAHVLTNSPKVIYSGEAAEAVFTVPEDSLETRFYFTAADGVTLRSASIDGETPLVLRYRLLPGFIANRMQGTTLLANGSVMLRVMLWRDGLRYWRLAPVFGHGLGSFESGITRVQDFDYETKYTHNHYIQVLLESGVIGLTLFLAAQIALGAALWKRRKAMREGEFAALYAAFVAEFVMNALQMLWDVQMSNIVFLCQSYAFYASIVLLCAEPLGQKADAPETEETADAKKKSAGKKRGKKAAKKPAYRPELRAACMLVPSFVAVTILGNMISYRLINGSPRTLEQCLNNLDFAEKIDLYEHNDARLNYCLWVAEERAAEYLPQANAHAEQLARLESNSIHMYLVEYYVNTQQYEKAVDMALLSTVYAASDESRWNDNIDLLQQALTDPGIFSPLLYQGDVLLPKLMDYYDAWQARNAVALMPIRLTPLHQRFFDIVLALDDCGGDTVKMAQVLSEANG